MLTQAYLKECLSYDPEIGIFTWNKRPRNHFKSSRVFNSWNARFSGKPTGCKDGKGYLVIVLDKVKHYAHRLAWLYCTGSMPRFDIDHQNGNGEDNRIINIRDVSASSNMKNAKRRSDNSSGSTGVYWHNLAQKWAACICIDGESVHLGLFNDISDAVASRASAERKYGFHENHGRPE